MNTAAEEMETRWSRLRAGLDEFPEAFPRVLRVLLEAAFREPELRHLCPFFSVDRLMFSRCTEFPYDTDGLPVLRPAVDGLVTVHVIGHGDVGVGTPEEAARLAAENLPPDALPVRSGPKHGPASPD
jgi:hypothetical protein